MGLKYIVPNNHAVFLRGQPRVWEYTHKRFFDSIHTMLGDNVDWYVATWKSNTTDYNKILKTFEGKNLIHLEILDQDVMPIPKNMRLHVNACDNIVLLPDDNTTTMFHGNWNLAFLDQVLNAKKCEHELKTGITYDKVLFTRPDVGFVFDNHTPVCLEDFECAGYKQGYFTLFNEVYMHDLFYICNSITADIIASRFLDTFITNPTKQFITPSEHAHVAQYFQKNHLTLTAYEGVTSFLFRPNTLYMLSKTDYTDDDQNAWEAWNRLSPEIRIKYITDLGIDPAEYNLVIT